MKQLDVKVIVSRDKEKRKKTYIARAFELGITEFGNTKDKAMKNLIEAVDGQARFAISQDCPQTLEVKSSSDDAELWAKGVSDNKDDYKGLDDMEFSLLKLKFKDKEAYKNDFKKVQ